MFVDTTLLFITKLVYKENIILQIRQANKFKEWNDMMEKLRKVRTLFTINEVDFYKA